MVVIYHITTKLSIPILHLLQKKESSQLTDWNVLFRRLERALRAPKTSPRHYAAATRIKDVVQFSNMQYPPNDVFPHSGYHHYEGFAEHFNTVYCPAAGWPHRGRLAPHQRPLAAAICSLRTHRSKQALFIIGNKITL